MYTSELLRYVTLHHIELKNDADYCATRFYCHDMSQCIETSFSRPGNYCEVAGNGTSTNLQYPFEPSCYPYVQCIKDFPLFYIRECPVGGAFCFNVTSGQCNGQKDNGKPLQLQNIETGINMNVKQFRNEIDHAFSCPLNCSVEWISVMCGGVFCVAGGDDGEREREKKKKKES